MKMTWCGLKINENCHVLVNQLHGNFHSQTLCCWKIKSVFSDVKWCFNASWGLKGLRCLIIWYIYINPYPAKGSCQIKKNQKIREKLGLFRPHPPIPPIQFFFFFETWNQHKKHKITQHFPRKIKITWSRVSLPRHTTSSDWKLLIFV